MNGPHFLFDDTRVLPVFPKHAIDVQIVEGEQAERLFAQHFAQRDLELAS